MRPAFVACVIAALCAMDASVAAQARLDLSVKGLVEKAVAYVADYEKQFAFLIAAETYHQTQFDADGRAIKTRELEAELFLTYLPADGEWIAVRDVAKVDGEAVEAREDLRSLLAKRQELSLVRPLTSRNAQYNIGRVERNFNEPTLPLLLLDKKRISRIRFTRKSVVREQDTTLVTIAFEEREPPTLVSAKMGGALKARGEFVMDAATGTIRRTLFRLAEPGIDVQLETTYAWDEKLELWLPAVFRERYESGNVGNIRSSSPAARASHELVSCEAKYSNYRRFEVTGRIK